MDKPLLKTNIRQRIRSRSSIVSQALSILAGFAILTMAVFSSGCETPDPDPTQVPDPTPKPTTPPRPVPVVVIDPGHGGSNNGAAANGLQEKEVVLTIGKAVRDYLESAGVTVHMTRDTEIYRANTWRANFANDKKADAFVSIHTNANYLDNGEVNPEPRGTTAIFADEASGRFGTRREKSRDLANKIYTSMLSRYQSHRSPYRNECWKDGEKTTCTVLDNTKMPAVIVETLFITNPDDANLLEYWDDDIAWLIAKGIIDYLWSEGYAVQRSQLYVMIGPDGEVGPGGEGGLESWPAWWDWENTPPAAISEPFTTTLRPSPLWKWGNPSMQRADERDLTGQVAVTYTIPLTDLLPLNVLSGTTRLLSQPEVVLDISNAQEAIAADYVIPISGTDVITAAVAAYRTVGSVYAHDYAVCGRFKEGCLIHATPVTVSTGVTGTPPVYFWGARMRRPDFIQEDATTFSIYVSANELDFVVDSWWISDQYPITDTGYILTFHIWAVNAEATGALAGEVLANLAARGNLHYRNDHLPAAPQAFIATANYRYGQATFTMINNSTLTKTVTFTAVTWSAPYPRSEDILYFTRSVGPGTSVVQLPMPAKLNAVVYANDGGGFVDKVYIADGSWFSWDDSFSGGTSQAGLHSENCTTYQGTSDALAIAGCARLTGTVATTDGYIGLARELAAFGRPVDLSDFNSVRFNYRGDGKTYLVKLETWVSEDHSYQYGYVLNTSDTWQQILIPFAAFEPLWGSAEFHPYAVKIVSWATMGGPYESIELEIDELAFIAAKQVYLPLVSREHH